MKWMRRFKKKRGEVWYNSYHFMLPTGLPKRPIAHFRVAFCFYVKTTLLSKHENLFYLLVHFHPNPNPLHVKSFSRGLVVKLRQKASRKWLIGSLHDPVTWYRINYAGTVITQWVFRNRGTRTSPVRLSLFLKSHFVVSVPA